MKSFKPNILFLALTLCLVSLGFSQLFQYQTHSRNPIGSALVTFTAYNKTAGYVISPDSGTTWQVWIDTSSTGSAGQYKRIDNTADSGRSNAVLIQHDSTGRYMPDRNLTLAFYTRAGTANTDSNGLQLQVYRRWVVPFKNAGTRRSTTYSYPNKNGAGMIDTVTAIANGGVANVKVMHYGEISPHGTYIKIRPNRIAATGKVVTDTSKFDSLWVIY